MDKTSMETKLAEVAEAIARIENSLNEAVVKKDEYYKGLQSVRSEMRKTVGILTGVLITLGSALGWILKSI